MKYLEIFESENIERKVWHVTPMANVSKIMEQGLLPKIGIRSKSAKESKKAIYVFPDSLSMEDALTNWLDNEFEDIKLSILELTIPNDWLVQHSIRWEAQILHAVPPSMIKVLVPDINFWHGEYPGGNPPAGWLPGLQSE